MSHQSFVLNLFNTHNSRKHLLLLQYSSTAAVDAVGLQVADDLRHIFGVLPLAS